MRRSADRRGLTRARAIAARLFAVAFLIASLLVPSFAEAAAPEQMYAAPTMTATADQDGASGTSSRPHGMAHAGAHCACHLADRLVSTAWVGPTGKPVVVQATFTSYTRASHEADPPARPPRA